MLLMIVSFIWTRIVARRTRILQHEIHGSFIVGERFVQRFTVRNAAPLPVASCYLEAANPFSTVRPAALYSLLPGEAAEWSIEGSFERRGKFEAGTVRATVGDPFGLFSRIITSTASESITVYPRLHAMDDVLRPLFFSSGVQDVSSGMAADVPPEASGIREYDPTDGQSRIHWRSSAKWNRLMSRTYESHQPGDVVLILDLARGRDFGEAPESTLEYRVSIAASLAHAVLRRRQAVSLVANDRDLTVIPAARGETQRHRVFEYLANCAPTGREPLGQLIERNARRWRGRGGVVILTSDTDPDWVEKLLASGRSGQKHLCIYVEPSSFGGTVNPMRISPAWRAALDWWIVRRGDVLDGRGVHQAVAM